MHTRCRPLFQMPLEMELDDGMEDDEIVLVLDEGDKQDAARAAPELEDSPSQEAPAQAPPMLDDTLAPDADLEAEVVGDVSMQEPPPPESVSGMTLDLDEASQAVHQTEATETTTGDASAKRAHASAPAASFPIFSRVQPKVNRPAMTAICIGYRFVSGIDLYWVSGWWHRCSLHRVGLTAMTDCLGMAVRSHDVTGKCAIVAQA
eukprot:9474428-Pyramimonas_sp.AAC.1